MRPILSKNKKLLSSSKPEGFTLVEILVSITLFVIVVSMAVQAYLNILTSYRRLDVSGRVYESGRFLMERLVKEIRNNSIDYGYYYLTDEDNAGLTYWDYLAIPPSSSSPDVQMDTSVQPVLALISNDGKERTVIGSGRVMIDSGTGLEALDTDRTNPNMENYRIFLKRMHYNAADNEVSNPSGSVTPDPLTPLLAFPDIDPYDEEADLTVNWEWFNDPQFQDDSGLTEDQRITLGWQPFSGNDISIRSLSFIVTPVQDPYKYWDTSNGDTELLNQQSQPMVTINMQVTPSIRNRAGVKGEMPVLDLQTTVSLRSYKHVYYHGWPTLN